MVRLRLLNIDAPERRTADHGPQCLAEAATTRLIELALAAPNSPSSLRGRTVTAAPWVKPGSRTAACSAPRSSAPGWPPVTIGGQDTFRAEMDVAKAEAAANARGLHDPKENCSLPAHVVPRRASTRHTSRGRRWGSAVDRRRHRPGRPDQRAPARALQPSPLPSATTSSRAPVPC